MFPRWQVVVTSQEAYDINIHQLPSPSPSLCQNMNITPQQVLKQIRGIKDAIHAGLKTGNIKTVMKEQKRALVRHRHALGTMLTQNRNNYLLGKGRY
jgi:hypothetical protein